MPSTTVSVPPDVSHSFHVVRIRDRRNTIVIRDLGVISGNVLHDEKVLEMLTAAWAVEMSTSEAVSVFRSALSHSLVSAW